MPDLDRPPPDISETARSAMRSPITHLRSPAPAAVSRPPEFAGADRTASLLEPDALLRTTSRWALGSIVWTTPFLGGIVLVAVYALDAGDVGGEEVDALAVEVVAGSVVVLGVSRVGVAGQDLGVAEGDAGVQGVGDRRMPQ